MKFGGTSVGDVPRLQEVVAIVKKFKQEEPVVVASAMGGLTNVLLDTAQKAVERKTGEVNNAIAAIRHRHLQIANAMILDYPRRAHQTAAGIDRRTGKSVSRRESAARTFSPVTGRDRIVR